MFRKSVVNTSISPNTSISFLHYNLSRRERQDNILITSLRKNNNTQIDTTRSINMAD